MSFGAVEPFTAEERARLAPYFTNVDAPVFALVNLPEVVKGALFARYSRSPKSLRRLFLDEFADLAAEEAAPARERRHRAGGASLRARVRRVRGRLGRPAGRGAPRVRGRLQRAHEAARVGPPHGVPRAVDPLRPVRGPARRALALPRAGGGARDAARARVRGDARPHVRDVRPLARADAGALPPPPPAPGGGLGGGLPEHHPGEGPRHPAGAPARPRRGRTSGSTARGRRTRRSCCASARRRSPRRARARTSC